MSGHELHSPELFWSEGVSSIHQKLWRREISTELAGLALTAFLDAPIEGHSERELYRRAWQIAQQTGWAKTYDAEYVALAQILDCPLITLDARLARGGGQVARIVGPADI